MRSHLPVAVLAFTLWSTTLVAGQWSPPPPAVDPGPSIPTIEYNWDLGALYWHMKYTLPFTLTNNCDSPRTITLFTEKPAEFGEWYWPTFGPCGLGSCQVTVQGHSSRTDDTSVTMTGPGEPEKHPEHFFVDDPLARGVPVRPFSRIAGTLIAVYRGEPSCPDKREVYNISARVAAQRLDIPPPPPEKQKLAGPAACEVWWNIGQKPDTLKPDENCDATIQPLAAGYRKRILESYVTANPAAWAWLPSADAIRLIESETLVRMKLRAEAQLVRAGR